MYDTVLSDYKITNTPFKRDPLAELAAVCAKRSDIKLGFYSSTADWHHPAYRFRQESGSAWGDYLHFLHGQVRELCTNYGEVACLWFDGDLPHHPFSEKDQYFKPGGSFEYEELYTLIHSLQPNAVILTTTVTQSHYPKRISRALNKIYPEPTRLVLTPPRSMIYRVRCV